MKLELSTSSIAGDGIIKYNNNKSIVIHAILPAIPTTNKFVDSSNDKRNKWANQTGNLAVFHLKWMDESHRSINTPVKSHSNFIFKKWNDYPFWWIDIGSHRIASISISQINWTCLRRKKNIRHKNNNRSGNSSTVLSRNGDISPHCQSHFPTFFIFF